MGVVSSGVSVWHATVSAVFDLSTDPRTSTGYAEAHARNAADSMVGLPERRGPAVERLLRTLGPDEDVRWLSWAYELKDGPTAWWVVVLTHTRLIGVSPTNRPLAWATGVSSWSTGARNGGDVVLHIPGGAPLRVRGSGQAWVLFEQKSETASLSSPIAGQLPPAAQLTDTTADSTAVAPGEGADRLTPRQARKAAGPRPRRPRKRWVRKQWVGFEPPTTIWEMADRCVKCGRPLTNPQSRRARVGTKCIQIYGSQQRRIRNPQHATWIKNKTRSDVAYVAEKARAEAEFARAKATYDEARATWKQIRTKR